MTSQIKTAGDFAGKGTFVLLAGLAWMTLSVPAARADKVVKPVVKPVANPVVARAENQVEKAILLPKAKSLSAAGYASTAIAIYRKVIAAYPDDLETRNDLTVFLINEKRYKEALELANQVLAVSPNDRVARSCRATIYERTGEPEKALADLEAYRKLRGLNVEHVIMTARLNQKLGRGEAARKNLALAERLKRQFEKHKAVREEVEKLARTGKSKQALARLDALMKADKNDPYYYFLKANIYNGHNQPERVVHLLTQLLEHCDYEPENIDDDQLCEVYQARGTAYAELGQNARALADLTEHLRLFPGDSGAYVFRAGVLNSLNQPRKALKDLKIVERIGHRYERRDGYAMMSAIYTRLGQTDKALYYLGKGFDEGDTTALHRRASLYGKRGEWQKAIADLSRALSVTPKVPVLLVDRGIAYTKVGKLDLALKDLTAAVNVDPGRSKRARRERARVYDLMGKKDLASRDRETAARQTGDNTTDF
ncbi:MAG: tetratricopeptide repeat protein [Candidatus Obscuribacterales bacterium]